GRVMQINAEIGKLEAEVRMILESRGRLAAQVETLSATRERRVQEAEGLQVRATELKRQIEVLQQQLAEAGRCVEDHAATLPQLEDAYRGTREAMEAARAESALAEQSIDSIGVEQRAVDRQLGS